MHMASAPRPKRNGVVAAAGRSTARLLSPVRALAAPELEHLVDRLLAGPLPEAVARSLVDNHVLERVAAEALQRADLEEAMSKALASPEADVLVDRVVNSPAFKRALEEALASPSVRVALARQGEDAAADALDRLRTSLATLDDSAERAPRRLFGRPTRAAPPPEAGFATRGLALVLDAALVNLGFLAGAALVALIVSLAGNPPVWVEALLAGTGFTVAVIVYFVFFWTVSGSTPGMALVRLRVLTIDGRPLGLGRAFARVVSLLLSVAILFLGFLPALVSDRRRALQDYLAGTVVVRDLGA
jgi:uncharacterized RDD family membrane protein YckC